MLGFYLSLLNTADEKSKFEELYHLYRQDMYKAAFGILKNHYEAEDAVHDAFIIVAKNLNKISQINCPRTHGYLIIIVRNLAFKNYNKNKKTNYIYDSEILNDTDIADIEEDILSKIGCEKISELLLKLPEDYYQVLYLNLFMGFDINSISENLGITYEDAKKRLQRAKLKFRRSIEENFNYEN